MLVYQRVSGFMDAWWGSHILLASFGYIVLGCLRYPALFERMNSLADQIFSWYSIGMFYGRRFIRFTYYPSKDLPEYEVRPPSAGLVMETCLGPSEGTLYIYKNNVIINPNHWVGDMFITFYNPNQVSFWNMLGTAFWLGLLKGFAPTARPAHSHRRLRCWHSLAVSGNKWYHDSYIASICKCQPLSKVHIDVELLCIHAITTSLQSTYLNMLKQFKTS